MAGLGSKGLIGKVGRFISEKTPMAGVNKKLFGSTDPLNIHTKAARTPGAIDAASAPRANRKGKKKQPANTPLTSLDPENSTGGMM